MHDHNDPDQWIEDAREMFQIRTKDMTIKERVAFINSEGRKIAEECGFAHLIVEGPRAIDRSEL